jgi:hypothetical protein
MLIMSATFDGMAARRIQIADALQILHTRAAIALILLRHKPIPNAQARGSGSQIRLRLFF